MKRCWYGLGFIFVFLCNLSAHDCMPDRAFHDKVILFSGNANRSLAENIAKNLHTSLADATVSTFNDGEIQIQIGKSVRNKDVFIVQPTCVSADQSVNDNLMELYLLIRTMKRASANSITVVVPYFGYARQDRKAKSRVPISASDIAYLIEKAGATRVVTIDLHCGQIQGFFQNIPVDNLYGSLVFAPYIAEQDLKNIVVVSPDAGGVERANQFICELNKKGIKTDLALISKQRAKAGVIKSAHLIGDVQDADAIIIDDMCDTGGTLAKAAELLKANGARRVFVLVTHPVFSKQALQTIKESVIDQMIIADTIPIRGELPVNITVVSMAPLLADAILRIQRGESVSELFQD